MVEKKKKNVENEFNKHHNILSRVEIRIWDRRSFRVTYPHQYNVALHQNPIYFINIF